MIIFCSRTPLLRWYIFDFPPRTHVLHFSLLHFLAALFRFRTSSLFLLPPCFLPPSFQAEPTTGTSLIPDTGVGYLTDPGEEYHEPKCATAQCATCSSGSGSQMFSLGGSFARLRLIPYSFWWWQCVFLNPQPTILWSICCAQAESAANGQLTAQKEATRKSKTPPRRQLCQRYSVTTTEDVAPLGSQNQTEMQTTMPETILHLMERTHDRVLRVRSL